MNSIVYNMDCMQGMKQYPDKYFDLAVVDPPYGIDVSSMNMGSRKTVKPDKSKVWDKSIPDESYFEELKRISKHQIIWGANYFPCLGMFNPKAKRIEDFKKLSGFVWDKGESMLGRDFSEAEIAFCSMGEAWFKMSPNQLDRIHPTQKPIKLYDFTYKTFLPSGGKVIDTHLGSGSNRIAADKAGNIDFVAFELDKCYFKDEQKRFSNYKSQLTLF